MVFMGVLAVGQTARERQRDRWRERVRDTERESERDTAKGRNRAHLQFSPGVELAQTLHGLLAMHHGRHSGTLLHSKEGEKQHESHTRATDIHISNSTRDFGKVTRSQHGT